MEMGDDELTEAGALQEIEEHHGIDAAGNTDDGGFIFALRPDATEKARQEIGRFFHAPQAAVILAAPKYGWRISGKCTDPSGCCPFSSKAT